MAAKERIKISEREVQAALQRFVAKGGLIHQLPAQRVPARRVGEGHFAFENPMDALSLGDLKPSRNS